MEEVSASIEHENSLEHPLFRRKMNNFYFPLQIHLEPSFQMTHSDVMCIRNSGIRNKNNLRDTKTSRNSSKEHNNQNFECKLPCVEIYSSKKNREKKTSSKNSSKKVSSIEMKHVDTMRQKLEKELHAEHRIFMTNLKRDREERYEKELQAALVIQRYMRGYYVRRQMFPQKYLFYKNKKWEYSEDDIIQQLTEIADRIGIHISP